MAQTQRSIEDIESNKWNFYKGRNTALGILNGLIKKHDSHKEHWLPQVKLLKSLKDFPNSSIDLRGLDIGAKSKLLKSHLTELFPDTKLKVKATRLIAFPYIEVTIQGGDTPNGLREICEIYQDRGQINIGTGSHDWDNKVKIKLTNPKVEKPSYITGDDW